MDQDDSTDDSPVIDSQIDWTRCHEGFFQCGAVKLAKKLLGQYLYCQKPDSDPAETEFLVRILETEAYPHGDDVYHKIFGDIKFLEEKSGLLLEKSAGLHFKSTPYKGDGRYLYITAGGESDSSDIVFIRAIQPIEGVEGIKQRLGINDSAKNITMNPFYLPVALGHVWRSNSTLYERGGAELVLSKRTVDGPNEAAHGPKEAILHGKRILPKPKYPKEIEWSGRYQKYRFALDTEDEYDYHQKDAMEEMPAEDLD